MSSSSTDGVAALVLASMVKEAAAVGAVSFSSPADAIAVVVAASMVEPFCRGELSLVSPASPSPSPFRVLRALELCGKLKEQLFTHVSEAIFS